MNIKKQIKTGISQNQIDFLRKHSITIIWLPFPAFLSCVFFLPPGNLLPDPI